MSLEPQAPSRPYRIYRLALALAGVVDISDSDVLASLGVTEQHLRETDPPSCRMVGQVADWMHQDGLLVPSVRSPGSNLVILKNQLDPGTSLEATLVERIGPRLK